MHEKKTFTFSLQKANNFNNGSQNSNSKFDTDKNPLAFTIFPEENNEGRDFVPEPPLLKEKISNWMNLVLIPFSLPGKLLALLGPYPIAKSHSGKVKNFFPGFPVIMTSAFEEHALDLSFMDKLARVF